tara:strand:- start:1786 stop:2736 length:951 start_codon:yes stop_codon:yes gene_type:complete
MSLSVVPALAFAQAGPEASSPMEAFKTPWGHPDLQGIWTNTTTTPLERPDDLAGKEVLTEEERAIRNPEVGISDERPSGDPVGFYNDYWLEQGVLSKQTSLIVDPPDGKLPETTEAEKDLQSRRTSSYSSIAGGNELRFDSWADFNAYDRCISRGMPGAMTPGFYNHNYQIFQTADHVVIMVEMIHDARIIPLDGRAHVDAEVRQWMGDSRGRWDGDTLVIETKNFNNKIQQRTGTVSGGDSNLHLIERFTRVDADTLDYQVTVMDPTIWTEKWTVSMPMSSLEGSLFEYACHEGNYFLQNALRGSRAAESVSGQQ